MPNLKLTGQQIQQAAKAAGVDIRTMVRYLAGDEIRKMASERIRSALAAAGLLVLLLMFGCSDYTGAPRGGDVVSVEPDAGALVEPDTMPTATPDTMPDTRPDAYRPDARVLADTMPADTVPAVAPDTRPAMPESCAVPKVLVYGNSCEKYWTGTKIGCAHNCLIFGTKEDVQVSSPCLTTGSERDPGGWTGKVICVPSRNDCAKLCTTPIN